MILEAVSRTPNIRTTISIKINRHDPKLDVLALLEIVQRSVTSIEIDMNYFFNQFQTTDVQPSFYSLKDYNALEQFRMLGNQYTRKEVDWKTLLPESIRNLILIPPHVIRALPTNLRELEITRGSRVNRRNLDVIFELQFLSKLSLAMDISNEISDEDIPSEFRSQHLTTFNFQYYGNALITKLMEVIARGCPDLQVLQLRLLCEVEIRLLDLCFGFSALTTFHLRGGQSNYTVEDICSSLETTTRRTGHQTLKSMLIPYPQSISGGSQGVDFSRLHKMASLLPNSRAIGFGLSHSNFFAIHAQEIRKTLHGIKLHYFTPDPCLELCTILVSSGEMHADPKLVILVPPLRRCSFHK
jgi:hypothetical protein